MTDQEPSTADRFRRVAATFTERVEGVGADGWESPSPCEGWVARDVVRHLAGWIPGFMRQGTGRDFPEPPSVDDDPVDAWATLRDALQAILDDPSTADAEFDHPMAGKHPLAVAIDRFVLGDVLVHTWDLARATGQDDTIDEAEAARMYQGMLPMADMLAKSGQFGERVAVPDDADTQTKLLGLTGRSA